MKKATKIILTVSLAMMVLGGGISAGAWVVAGGDIGVEWSEDTGLVHVAYGNVSSKQLTSSAVKLKAFTSVVVNSEYGDVEFIPSTGGYRVEYTTLSSHAAPSISVTNGKLTISNTNAGKEDWNLLGKTIGAAVDKCFFRIYYPAGTELTSARVESGMGEVDMDNTSFAGAVDLFTEMGDIDVSRMQAKTVKISTDMGEISVEGLTADSLDVSSEMGDIDVEESTLAGMNASLSMGDFDFSGKLTGKTTVKSDMGDVDMELRGKKADYFLDLETSMGERTLNDRKYRASDAGNANAANHIVVTCSWGSVDIELN